MSIFQKTIIPAALALAATFGFSAAALSAEADSASINCTAGPTSTGVRALAPNPPQGDWVTLNATGLAAGTTITFAITSSGGLTANPSQQSGSATGSFDVTQLNPANQSTTFTVTGGTDGVFRITRVSSGAGNVWSTWSATCGEVANPSMTVVKSSDVATYNAVGDIIAYTVAVTNTGNVTLNNLSVGETSFNGNGTAPTFTCGTTTLAPTASTNCTGNYTVVQDDLDQGQIDNVANATTDEVGPQDSNQVTVTAVQGASMTVVKSSDVSTYNAVGDVIAYTVAVTNNGNVTLNNLSVTETSFNGNGTAPTFTCGMTTLAPTASTNCTGNYTVVQDDLDQGQIDNIANATTDEVGPQDSNQVTVTAAQGASLSLTKTADQATFDENDTTILYTYTIENTGDVPLTNINVQDSKIGQVADCNTASLAPDDPAIVCVGSYDITALDIANGEITNTAIAYGTDESTDDVQSNEAEETVTYVGPDIEDKVDEVTREFLFRRMDRLLSDGPDRARLLRKCEDRGYAGDLRASGGSGEDLNVEFGTSLSEVRAYGARSAERKLEATDDNSGQGYGWLGPSFKKSGGSGADLLPVPVYAETPDYTLECNPFDVWIEGHYTSFDSDFGDGDFGVAYVGADYLVNDNLLLGLLAQFDWTSMDENGDDVDGFGWMIGPYMSAEIVQNVFFDARFAWGQSDNDVTVNLSGVPFSGDFDTDRWLAQAALYGNFTNGNWRVTPEVSVAYIEEKRKTFSVSDNAGLTNTTVNSETLSLGRLTAGPEVAYRFDYGSLIFEPQVAVNLIWDFHAQGDDVSGIPVYETDPRGAVELGLGIQADNGWAARFGAKYDGIGADGFDAYSFNGWLNIPF